jgi:histidyl-tRNA synthetase
LGMERIFPALAVQGIEIPIEPKRDVYLAALGEAAAKEAFRLQHVLRRSHLTVEMDYLSRGLKAQLKAADRIKAKFAVILGDAELEQGIAIVRLMDGSRQEEVKLTELPDYLLANS